MRFALDVPHGDIRLNHTNTHRPLSERPVTHSKRPPHTHTTTPTTPTTTNNTHTPPTTNHSTTSTPSLAQRIHAAAAAQGISAVDAPVSGGDIGAKSASLSFMIGGDAPTVDALRPLFGKMGKNIRYMGGAGKGQHTKMVGGWEMGLIYVRTCVNRRPST
jgi:hypothetical protein